MALHEADHSHQHRISMQVLDQCRCAAKAKVPRNIFIAHLQHGSLHCILPSLRESSKNAGLLHQRLSLNDTQTVANYPTEFASPDWAGQKREKFGVKLYVTILGWYAWLHTVVHTTRKGCNTCLIEPLVAFPTVSL